MSHYFFFIVPIENEPINPCQPNLCGPYSQCKESSKGHAVCSCIPNMLGSPPMCRPECTSDDQCQSNMACLNLKCIDPCHTNTCDKNAQCIVQNHRFSCYCLEGFSGDPYTACSVTQSKLFIVSSNHRY